MYSTDNKVNDGNSNFPFDEVEAFKGASFFETAQFVFAVPNVNGLAIWHGLGKYQAYK